MDPLQAIKPEHLAKCKFCDKPYLKEKNRIYCPKCQLKQVRVDRHPNLAPLRDNGWVFHLTRNMDPGRWTHPDHVGEFITKRALEIQEGKS